MENFDITHKEDLAEVIGKAILSFYENTGCTIKEISIDWSILSSEKLSTGLNSITSIIFKMD